MDNTGAETTAAAVDADPCAHLPDIERPQLLYWVAPALGAAVDDGLLDEETVQVFLEVCGGADAGVVAAAVFVVLPDVLRADRGALDLDRLATRIDRELDYFERLPVRPRNLLEPGPGAEYLADLAGLPRPPAPVGRAVFYPIVGPRPARTSAGPGAAGPAPAPIPPAPASPAPAGPAPTGPAPAGPAPARATPTSPAPDATPGAGPDVPPGATPGASAQPGDVPDAPARSRPSHGADPSPGDRTSVHLGLASRGTPRGRLDADDPHDESEGSQPGVVDWWELDAAALSFVGSTGVPLPAVQALREGSTREGELAPSFPRPRDGREAEPVRSDGGAGHECPFWPSDPGSDGVSCIRHEVAPHAEDVVLVVDGHRSRRRPVLHTPSWGSSRDLHGASARARSSSGAGRTTS